MNTLEQVQAERETARQERDGLRAEVTHMLEVLTVWRAEYDRLRVEVARLRQEQRRLKD
jgi:hypothetical protein